MGYTCVRKSFKQHQLGYPLYGGLAAFLLMNLISFTTNVDVSTYTLLTQSQHTNSGHEVLQYHLSASTPGEEAIIFN